MSNILKICFIFFILITIFIKNAVSKEIDPITAANNAVIENLKSPAPDPDGRVQTLNKKGAMSPQLDQISPDFSKKVENIRTGYRYEKPQMGKVY